MLKRLSCLAGLLAISCSGAVADKQALVPAANQPAPPAPQTIYQQGEGYFEAANLEAALESYARAALRGDEVEADARAAFESAVQRTCQALRERRNQKNNELCDESVPARQGRSVAGKSVRAGRMTPCALQLIASKGLDDGCRMFEARLAGGNKDAALRYIIAQTHYLRDDFVAAAEAFETIIERHTGDPIVCDAADYLLDSLNGAQDFNRLALAAARIVQQSDTLGCAPETLERFALIEQKAAFHAITAVAKSGDHAAAATAFLDYAKRYGAPGRYAVEAMYNAAFEWDLADQPERAEAARQAIVEQFAPEHEIVIQTRLQLGARALAVGDRGAATEHFEAVLAVQPNNSQARDGLVKARLQADH